ncbi:MAG TPA: TetR family transcriptional regulator [Solirubrobacteraceae bacterium]
MQRSAKAADPYRELPGSSYGESPIHRLLVLELGEDMAAAFAAARGAEERSTRQRHPGEGLRARKKRILRQQISDVATTLFVVRGFDRVTVAEIAEIVGVSEKTVFNYFPTKESLVFDRVDEGVTRLVETLRGREPGEPPTTVVLRALGEDPEQLDELPEEIHRFTPVFAEMVACTPALRAAWLDMQDRLVQIATEELAAWAEVDPREPEPMIAARAVVALQDIAHASRIRHVEEGLRGSQLRDAVDSDLTRASRLLDTGLWSFGLLAHGAGVGPHLSEATSAAERGAKQVLKALTRARAAWRLRQAGKDLTPQQRGAAKRGASHAGNTAPKAARNSERPLRDAGAIAEQAAYEAFREMLSERHAAVRERQNPPSDWRAAS